MPRRIPISRRHTKLKSVDPDSKKDTEKKRKNQEINMAPTDINDQQIPRKVQELMKLKKLMKEKKFKKKKKIKKDNCIIVKSDKFEEEQKGMKYPLKYVPDKMKQRENETEQHFVWRIQQLINKSLTEAQMSAKFGVDVLEDEVGNLEVKSNKKEKTNKQMKRKLTEQKKKEKKRKRIEDRVGDFDHFSNEVKFGEVVIEPPKLTIPKKVKEKLKIGNRNEKLKELAFYSTFKNTG